MNMKPKYYQSQQKKNKLTQMFLELRDDKETLTLAEAGMGDYLEQITEYDK